jgi:hypothetical protein
MDLPMFFFPSPALVLEESALQRGHLRGPGAPRPGGAVLLAATAHSEGLGGALVNGGWMDVGAL